MKVFMVERNLGAISLDGLADAKGAANAEAERMTAAGTPVNYLRSTFVPEDGRCMCLFEAESEDAVRLLNDTAGLPYSAIVPAYDLTPKGIRGA